LQRRDCYTVPTSHSDGQSQSRFSARDSLPLHGAEVKERLVKTASSSEFQTPTLILDATVGATHQAPGTGFSRLTWIHVPAKSL